MLRFCDKDVCCVMEGNLDRQELISYFLNGNENEMVCVLDEKGRFIGNITYDSLLGNELKDSIKKDFVVLDENIWKIGRNYFRNIKKEFGGVAFLPVLDHEGFLISFAWQDYEANREIRMLDELTECEHALDFREVYPEYDCVTVLGFNELSYYFVKYLMKKKVPVNVCGEMWGEFVQCKVEEVLDYRNFVVYAEGVENKKEECWDSVSVEFECIDRIYEENIQKGIIKDGEGDFSDVINKLQGKKIAILGTGQNALNAYDLLLKYELNICCFISEDGKEKERSIFGKNIRGRAFLESEDIVFVDADYKNSAWGFGRVDYYYYFYDIKRNKRFYLLQDYMEIPLNGWLNIFEHVFSQTDKKLVLAGDFYLCRKLTKVIEKAISYTTTTLNIELESRIVYCDFLGEYNKEQCERMKYITADEIVREDMCILLLPKCYGIYESALNTKKEKRDQLLKIISEFGITNIVDYDIENNLLMDSFENSVHLEWLVGKIVIGAINYYSGNLLVSSIFDNHPDILMIHYGFLNCNLYSICMRLSMETSDNILHLFWKICKKETMYKKETKMLDFYRNVFGKVFTKELGMVEEQILNFNKVMKEMLSVKEAFSSQELFVILHIAYAKMLGQKVQDVSQMFIYWEPHDVPRDMCEHYAVWLRNVADSKYILNVVRNACIRHGSSLNFFKDNNLFSFSGKNIFQIIFNYPNSDKREYDGWQRIDLKFENLKCNLNKELRLICDKLELTWSDMLLKTTRGGVDCYYRGEVTGFDLAPVYRTYEEYFSEFDRFRISLINGPWQKKYDYPFECSLNFSRRELKQIFSKEFRFEERLIFRNEAEKIRFRSWVQRLASERLWENRRREIMEM